MPAAHRSAVGELAGVLGKIVGESLVALVQAAGIVAFGPVVASALSLTVLPAGS